MGMSYHPSIIIGVQLAELVKITETSKEYDVYDRKGNKTGEVASESTFRFSLTRNGEEKGFIQDTAKVYADSFEEVGLEDYPSVGGFGIFNTVYDSNGDIDDFIVGIKVLETDAMYDGLGEASATKMVETVNKVTNILKMLYGCEAEVKVFLDGGIG